MSGINLVGSADTTSTLETAAGNEPSPSYNRSEVCDLKAIFDLPDVVVIRDVDTFEIVAASQKAAAFWGTSIEDLISGKFDPVFHTPEVQPSGSGSLQAARSYISDAYSGQNPSFRWQYVKTCGSQVNSIVTMSRFANTSRRLVKIQIEDVDNLARCQFEDLFGAIPVASLVVDLGANKIRAANSQAAALWGVHPNSLIESIFTSLVSLQDENNNRQSLTEFVRAVNAKLKINDTFETQATIKTASGTSRAVVRMAPVPATAEPLVCVSVVEITARHHCVALEDLAGGVAHNYNNLLNVISGNLELISELASGPDGDAMIEDVLQSVDRGANLAANLLAFSGKQKHYPEKIMLPKIIEDIRGWLSGFAPSGIQLAFAADEKASETYFDRVKATWVLKNVIRNALEAMSEEGELTIGLTHETAREQQAQLPPEANQYICLSVADTGCGIPEESLDRVLNPFFTTKPTVEHSGLGLSAAYGIMKAGGGDLSITSKVGNGTRVKLHFPKLKPSP